MAQWTPRDIKAAKQSIVLSTIYCLLKGTLFIPGVARCSFENCENVTQLAHYTTRPAQLSQSKLVTKQGHLYVGAFPQASGCRRLLPLKLMRAFVRSGADIG